MLESQGPKTNSFVKSTLQHHDAQRPWASGLDHPLEDPSTQIPLEEQACSSYEKFAKREMRRLRIASHTQTHRGAHRDRIPTEEHEETGSAKERERERQCEILRPAVSKPFLPADPLLLRRW